LFVLGWIVMSIFGALCQLLPVAVGRSLRWPWAAHLSFAAQAAGVALFVAGFLVPSRPLLLTGAGCLSLAFSVFALNVAVTLATAPERSLTWWALAAAMIFLLV